MKQRQLLDALDWRGAEFSHCRAYRYRLWRRWEPVGPLLVVIGLNPSTADETEDDPTIRRCLGYARQWGFAGLMMCNLFAFRATDPKEMMAAKEPVGRKNLLTITTECSVAARVGGAVLAAWGAHGGHCGQSAQVRRLLIDYAPGSACLGLTKSGEPKHPLYLPKDATPIVFTGDGGRLVKEASTP